MPDPTRALTRQLLEWIADRPHTHAEAVEVWRTSCPRLSIWEDACADGLVDMDARTRVLSLTGKGRALLGRRERPRSYETRTHRARAIWRDASRRETIVRSPEPSPALARRSAGESVTTVPDPLPSRIT